MGGGAGGEVSIFLSVVHCGWVVVMCVGGTEDYKVSCSFLSRYLAPQHGVSIEEGPLCLGPFLIQHSWSAPCKLIVFYHSSEGSWVLEKGVEQSIDSAGAWWTTFCQHFPGCSRL